MSKEILQGGNVVLKIGNREIKADFCEATINHKPEVVSIEKYKKAFHFVKWVAAGLNYRTRTGFHTAEMCHKVASELLKELESDV